MSSSKKTQRQQMPFYSFFFSIRTLVPLVIALCSLLIGTILLWSGAGIMNVLIHQFGSEIIHEKLVSIIQPIEYRYETLHKIGLEDSTKHQKEIKENALKNLEQFRYKQTGSIFVVSETGEIILSKDFHSETDDDFKKFENSLREGNTPLIFSTDQRSRFCVFRFYEPWKSYIGLAIDEQELFVYKTEYIKIVLMLLAAVLLGIILFSSFIQRLLISPLIRVSKFANQVSKGDFTAPIEGKYILELGALKVDIEQMVLTLRQKMDETNAQLQLIGERERWLDEALKALQESEKKYRTIYNAPSDAILIYDPEHDNIEDANKGMFNMFGYFYDEIISMNLGDLSAGEYPFTQEEAKKLISATFEKGSLLSEWMCKKKDGEIFWVDMGLQATYLEGKKHIIAVMRNIHARKMAEQELASEKERLAVTLRSIGDGVITTDERGRIVLMNKVAETLTGWRQHEAVGRLFADIFHIVHQKTEQQCENPVEKILASGKTIDLAEGTILIAKDGTRRIIADSGAPIRNPDSQVIGSVIVFRDVTEEKRLEEELLKVKKLESVGVLAGGIAHDFNNILVGILGNISMARQFLGDTHKTEEMLHNTEKAALRAKDLTSQLLTFSRGGEPVLETASIATTIAESAEFALRGSNVKIILNIPNDLWLVKADTGQISQVIQNIVLNARQAISEHGTVEITCINCTHCDDTHEHLKDKCVRIIIRDDGPGIPEDVLGKIFDPYFTTKDDGSGLGLAICHSIITKHHGSISVESQLNEGTAFIINLPVSPEQQLNHHFEMPEFAFSDKKAKILIMDDDTMILELSKQMLEYLGHEVVTCEEGKIALKEYQEAMQENQPFDLVIMDLTIPGGMGGEKAIKELLKIDPAAKAIVSSGYSNDKVMAEYDKHGFKAVVIKPYQIVDLNKAIQKTLGE